MYQSIPADSILRWSSSVKWKEHLAKGSMITVQFSDAQVSKELTRGGSPTFPKLTVQRTMSFTKRQADLTVYHLPSGGFHQGSSAALPAGPQPPRHSQGNGAVPMSGGPQAGCSGTAPTPTILTSVLWKEHQASSTNGRAPGAGSESLGAQKIHGSEAV